MHKTKEIKQAVKGCGFGILARKAYVLSLLFKKLKDGKTIKARKGKSFKEAPLSITEKELDQINQDFARAKREFDYNIRNKNETKPS